MNPDLDKYWQQIVKDDEKALEGLYKSAFPILVQYAGSITGDHGNAEEVVQDVMLKLWQDRSVIVIQGSFTSYLFRSVHNHALNALRQHNTKRQSVNRPCSEELWEFISNVYELDEMIMDRMVANETNEIIENAVNDLPDQCRKVFRMSRFESLDNKDIATKLGLSENTIKTHIYNALQKIAGVLKRNR